MSYILLIVGFVVGVASSTIIFAIQNRRSGTLKIDHSNAEKDVYRFDVNDLDGLSKKRRIVLKVDNNADLSQK